MMLRPQPMDPIPPETARITHAAFPKGLRDLRLADELNTLFAEELMQERSVSVDHATINRWVLK